MTTVGVRRRREEVGREVQPVAPSGGVRRQQRCVGELGVPMIDFRLRSLDRCATSRDQNGGESVDCESECQVGADRAGADDVQRDTA